MGGLSLKKSERGDDEQSSTRVAVFAVNETKGGVEDE
jgi:hypothetical protein